MSGWAIAMRAGMIVLAVVVLGACQTDQGQNPLSKVVTQLGGGGSTGGSAADVSYSFMYTPADHINELVDAGRLDDASAVFNREREFFRQERENRRLALNRLAERLNSNLHEREKPLSAVLTALTVPLPPDRWDSSRAAMASAAAVLSEAEKHQILKDYRYQPSWLPGFEALHRKRLEDLQAWAPTAADLHYAALAQDFAAAYPVELGVQKSAVDAAIAAAVQRDAANLTSAQILAVHKTYGKLLTPGAQQALGLAYYRRALPDQPGLAAFARAAKLTRDAGLPLVEVPDGKVLLVDGTSPTLVRNGGVEFPVALQRDLPFALVKSDLSTALDSPGAVDASYLIILDVAAARLDRKITGVKDVESEYQSGTRLEANPAYNMAQNAVNQARNDLQMAGLRKMSADNQFCYGLGCIAAAVGQIAAGVAQSSAQEKLNESTRTLGNTPMQIERPVYQPYSFQRSEIDAVRLATVNYHVIDRTRRTLHRGTFDAREERKFTVAHGVHGRERNRSRLLAGVDEEKDVVAFEERPLEVPLSSILEHHETQAGQARPLPAALALRQELMADRNRALKAQESRTYRAVARAGDGALEAAMESTVMVILPKRALGSGFYVRDDLVLTNFHVIQGGQFVEMKLRNGQETFGKIVASDPRLDLALIKVQARGRPARFYNSQDIGLGESLTVIGHPRGMSFSVARGVLSAVRDLESNMVPGGRKVKFIQTDAAINSGNSGGPVFMNNTVVGVATWGLVGRGIEGLNFIVHYGEVLDFLRRNDVEPLLGADS